MSRRAVSEEGAELQAWGGQTDTAHDVGPASQRGFGVRWRGALATWPLPGAGRRKRDCGPQPHAHLDHTPAPRGTPERRAGAKS